VLCKVIIMNQFKHLRMSGLELMNNVKKKESINSLLLIIFLFIPTLTIPLKVYMNSGISVWILTLIIIIVSLSINKFKIRECKIFCVNRNALNNVHRKRKTLSVE